MCVVNNLHAMLYTFLNNRNSVCPHFNEPSRMADILTNKTQPRTAFRLPLFMHVVPSSCICRLMQPINVNKQR